MAFIKDPGAALEDAASLQSQNIQEQLRTSAQASGQRALDTFLGRRRVGPHDTIARTSHSVTIRVQNRFIGAITEFGPRQGREVKENFYLSPKPSGYPQELIPLNINERTIKIARYDLYRRSFETIFGDFDLNRLADQRNPFVIQEKLVDPQNRTKLVGFIGCFFKDLGYKYQAEGDRVIMYDATIIFRDKTVVS